jgi:hypothetical protein
VRTTAAEGCALETVTEIFAGVKKPATGLHTTV